MLESKTRILAIETSRYFLIPTEIFNDSQFPFKEGEEYNIKVIGKKLLINYAKNNKKRDDK